MEFSFSFFSYHLYVCISCNIHSIGLDWISNFYDNNIRHLHIAKWHHAMKIYAEITYTSALGGGEWSAMHYGLLVPMETLPTQYICIYRRFGEFQSPFGLSDEEKSVSCRCRFLRLCAVNVLTEAFGSIIVIIVLYGCETWSLTLREEHRLRVFCLRTGC
jgi:hypothetical protein